MTNLKCWENILHQIFNTSAFLFFLLTGATWYYYAIYIVFTYFALFTCFDIYIFEVISYLAEKLTNLEEKKAKAINDVLLEVYLKNKLEETGKQDETRRNGKKKKMKEKHQNLEETGLYWKRQ